MDFRAIYDEHVGFVFRTLNRFGVPERMLPDAVQEVFTVAFRSLDRFEGRSTMRTWLFGIARRIASDLRRSAPARLEVLDEHETPRDVPDSKSDLAVWGERNEALARAEAIVRALPDEQRVVFALFEIEEWTGAEIAEATDVPIATVHSRLRLAREGGGKGGPGSPFSNVADAPRSSPVRFVQKPRGDEPKPTAAIVRFRAATGRRSTPTVRSISPRPWSDRSVSKCSRRSACTECCPRSTC